MKTKTIPAPMTNERMEAIFARLRALNDDDERCVLWQTFGGIQWTVTNKPNARARAFFDALEERITEIETKNATRAA